MVVNRLPRLTREMPRVLRDPLKKKACERPTRHDHAHLNILHSPPPRRDATPSSRRAMAQPNAEDVNPLHVQWKNPEYLAFLSAQKGLAGVSQSVLDTSNVMDYFSSSPFYDRRSNNEHVRMQSAALMAEIMATQPQSSEEVLKKMARRHEEELKYVDGPLTVDVLPVWNLPWYMHAPLAVL